VPPPTTHNASVSHLPSLNLVIASRTATNDASISHLPSLNLVILSETTNHKFTNHNVFLVSPLSTRYLRLELSTTHLSYPEILPSFDLVLASGTTIHDAFLVSPSTQQLRVKLPSTTDLLHLPSLNFVIASGIAVHNAYASSPFLST